MKQHHLACLIGLLSVCILPLLPVTLPSFAASGTETTVRVSIDSNGGQGNSSSNGASISADGRYTAFSSVATNLVPNDTNGVADIFIHDQVTGQTIRGSVASDGTQANGVSGDFGFALSANGRYVAFRSQANNLVPNDTNSTPDIFLFDIQTHQITRISVASDGTQSNGFSSYPAISADGRYTAFSSTATNLIPGGTDGTEHIFIRDIQANHTSLVSVSSNGTPGNLTSTIPAISADGRYVSFSSDATNLVSGDTNGQYDVFVYDRQTSQTTRVSVATNGAQGNGESAASSISTDGRYVAFESFASNLVANDTNADVSDVFIHDRQSNQTILVSLSTNGTQGNNASDTPSISNDGQYLAFRSDSTNLVAGDTNNSSDIFVRDLLTGETTRVSNSSNGTQANGSADSPSISSDGRYIGFSSTASNLVLNDTNNFADVFQHDKGTPATSDQYIVFDSTRNGNREIYAMNIDGSNVRRLTNTSSRNSNPTCSPNGQYVAFSSDRTGTFQGFVMNYDGANARALDNRTAEEIYPSWSPDSKAIAYAVKQTPTSTRQIEVLGLDGSTRTLASGTFPAWSPDGQQIAYESNSQIALMRADNGAFLGKLTSGAFFNGQPAWSPNGQRIAFVSNRDGNNEIYVMNNDGSNQVRLTNSVGDDQHPFWSIDGSKIIFWSNRTGNVDIYIMNADGNNVQNLTNNPEDDSSPAWCTPFVESSYSISGRVTHGNIANSIVAVDAQVEWYDTGLAVLPGDQIQISYVSGTWSIWQGVDPATDGNGQAGRLEVCALVPSANISSLVGRVGNGTPRFVGNSATFSATNSGILQLSINDCNGQFDNNGGSLTVHVTVTPASTVGISGVSITATGSNNAYSTTDANGDYILSGLGAGTYTITPSKNGYRFEPTSFSPVTLPPSSLGPNFTGTFEGHYFEFLPLAVSFPSASAIIQAPTPYLSQLEQPSGTGSYVGWDNCGPASVAMVMSKYGQEISVAEAAKAIRKNDDPYVLDGTDFRAPGYKGTGQNTLDLLTAHGLLTTNVNSFDELKAQLDLTRPVIVLVYNHYYVRKEQGRLVPYYQEGGFSMNGTNLVPHIVVVTGYDNENVYINDPIAVTSLRRGGFIPDPELGTNFSISIGDFKKATSTVAIAQNLGVELYGMAINLE